MSTTQTNTKVEDNKMNNIKPCTEHKVYAKKRKTSFSELPSSLGETKKLKL